MENFFDKWNAQKQKLNLNKHKLPNEREVWWVYVGKNIGWEQNGSEDTFLRPVLVFRLFNSKIFFGIPMTSGKKNEKSWYYFKSVYNGNKYFFLLTQARLFSTKRLHQLIRTVSKYEFTDIKAAFKRVMKI